MHLFYLKSITSVVGDTAVVIGSRRCTAVSAGGVSFYLTTSERRGFKLSFALVGVFDCGSGS